MHRETDKTRPLGSNASESSCHGLHSSQTFGVVVPSWDGCLLLGWGLELIWWNLLSNHSLPVCLLYDLFSTSLIGFVELLILVIDSLPIFCALVEVHRCPWLPLVWLHIPELRSYSRHFIRRSEVINGVLGGLFGRSISLLPVLIDHWLLNCLFFMTGSKHWKLNGVFPIIHFILTERHAPMMLLGRLNSVLVRNDLRRTYLSTFIHSFPSEVHKIRMGWKCVLV